MCLVEMNSHCDNAIDNIIGNWSSTIPNKRLKRKITCFSDSCLTPPLARCTLCSKNFCYDHVQLCLFVHSNEIEILNPLKNKIHS